METGAHRIESNFPIYRVFFLGWRRVWSWNCAGCHTWKVEFYDSLTLCRKSIAAGIQEFRSPGSHFCKTGCKSNAKITNIHHKELISWVAQVVRRAALERKWRSSTPLILDPVFPSPPHSWSFLTGMGISQLPILTVAVSSLYHFHFMSVSWGLSWVLQSVLPLHCVFHIKLLLQTPFVLWYLGISCQLIVQWIPCSTSIPKKLSTNPSHLVHSLRLNLKWRQEDSSLWAAIYTGDAQ